MLELPLSLSLAFVMGLLSTGHCVGMCGAISGALGLGVAAPLNQPYRRTQLLALYSVGRVSSYALAGALLGGLSAGVISSVGAHSGHQYLQIGSALMLLLIGLYLSGWLPQLARLEKLGMPLWRRVQPLAVKMLPVRFRWQALAYGGLWGWLPCGMVYTVLFWAATTGAALDAAGLMLAFGLGTVPGMFTTAYVAQSLKGFTQKQVVRRISGIAVMASALLFLFLALNMQFVPQPLWSDDLMICDSDYGMVE